MKPQCETAAACLRELARVMEQFGITYPSDAFASNYIKCCNRPIQSIEASDFFVPSDWAFAIAEVEGKPVFVGDELYSVINGNKYTATEAGWAFDNWTYGPCTGVENMSWNQPKPKTILVEMLVEDAEEWAKYSGFRCGHAAYNRLYSICKKALEKQ